MIHIGSLELTRVALLAPMAGVTDLPFRLLCREQGASLTTTEMVSAKGLVSSPKGCRAYVDLLARAPQEGPVAAQLFGREPDVVAEAARRLMDMGFCAIDLNMGCPAPKVTSGGAGSALLRDLPLAARIIAACRRATTLPLTVKMRAGWDEGSLVAVDLARMAEAEGADALVVHGRTRAQFYAGQADWSHVADVKAAVRIPVIGNGDIFSAQDALNRMKETGCDGVMVGRGALGNPWIFSQINGAPPVSPPTPAQRAQTALRHARMLCAWKGEGRAVREMRKHACWYVKGLPGAAKMRASLHETQTLRDLEEALAPWRSE